MNYSTVDLRILNQICISIISEYAKQVKFIILNMNCSQHAQNMDAVDSCLLTIIKNAELTINASFTKTREWPF